MSEPEDAICDNYATADEPQHSQTCQQHLHTWTLRQHYATCSVVDPCYFGTDPARNSV